MLILGTGWNIPPSSHFLKENQSVSQFLSNPSVKWRFISWCMIFLLCRILVFYHFCSCICSCQLKNSTWVNVVTENVGAEIIPAVFTVFQKLAGSDPCKADCVSFCFAARHRSLGKRCTNKAWTSHYFFPSVPLCSLQLGDSSLGVVGEKNGEGFNLERTKHAAWSNKK